MSTGHTRDLPLMDARLIIARAINKAEQLQLRGGIAVVGASGALVSASRMDRGGAGGMARAWSKAWIAATQQIPSSEHLNRMNTIAAPVALGFVACSPEAKFPGAGGMPVIRDDHVVAGVAASGATVSPFFPHGVEPEQMIADGQPANPEDLLVHYALGLPYVGQHGDDHARWVKRFGGWPSDPGGGLGMAEAPAASKQAELDWALGLADAVIREAETRDVKVALAIVDHRGDPIQLDTMDGAPTSAVFAAQALAAAAATFQCPSDELHSRYPSDASMRQLEACLPFQILTVQGGLPVEEGGLVVAAVGVAGPRPDVAADIAASALGRR